MTPPSVTHEWSASELKRRLDDGERPFVLDVRNEDEFAAWQIEGPGPLASQNVPYFEMLERGGKEDMVESLAAFAERELTSLPTDVPILVVCAKGGTSAFVAEALRGLRYAATNLEGGMIGWARLVETRALVESPALSIYQVSRPARGCLSYVVASKRAAVVVDPLRAVEPYETLAREKGFEIRFVVDTHGHADHLSGGRVLANRSRAPYYLHPYDAIHPIDVLTGDLRYTPLLGDAELTVGDARLRALHVPGHTLGNMALVVNDAFLLSGDSLFLESVSRPDLGGRAEPWASLHYRSLRRLLALDDETMVLPGHVSSPSLARATGLFGEPLGALRDRNEGARLALGDEASFLAYILASLPVFPPEYVEVKRVNIGLAAVDDERATELELGKNLCALARCDHPPAH